MNSEDLSTLGSQDEVLFSNGDSNSDYREWSGYNMFSFPQVASVDSSDYLLSEESPMEQIGTIQSTYGNTTPNSVQPRAEGGNSVATNTTQDDDDANDNNNENKDSPTIAVFVVVLPQGERSQDHQANSNETTGEDEEVNSDAMAQGDNENALLLPIPEEDVENPIIPQRNGETVCASRKRTGRMKPRTHIPDKVKEELLRACREYQDTHPKTEIKSIAHILYLRYHDTPEFRHLSEESILRFLYKNRDKRNRVYMKGLY